MKKSYVKDAGRKSPGVCGAVRECSKCKILKKKIKELKKEVKELRKCPVCD